MSYSASEPRTARAGRTAQAAAVCIAVSSITAWLYAPYGYNGLDDGFIQGLSWRVANGQVPYLDFIYIRPPGSILLHALPILVLPDGLQAIFERWWFFLSAGAYSFLAAAVLTRVVDVREWNLPRNALAFLFFVASVQNFPPMAWHTVDGVLLAVCAVFCLCCTRGTTGLALGALLAVLSASCKQSFFPVPVAVCLYTAYARGRRDAAIVTSVVVAVVAAAGAALAAAGALGEAIQQCTGTSLGSLFHAGFVSYARSVPYFLLPLAAWWLAAAALRRFSTVSVPPAGMAYAAVLWIFGSDIALTLVQRRFQTPAFNYPGALFLVAALTVLLACRRNRDAVGLDGRARAALMLLLLVSWCASISWGYPSPVLLSAPLWFCALYVGTTYLGAAPRRVLMLALPLALASQFVGYLYPYREAPRTELTVPLGETFKRLSHVYTSRENRGRFDELRRLAERHPRFTVLPALPSAHYLTGALPPVGIDWARNSEAAGRTEELIRELEESGAYVFFELSAEPLCETGPECSGLATHVTRHWTVVETGRNFRVYRVGNPRPSS